VWKGGSEKMRKVKIERRGREEVRRRGEMWRGKEMRRLVKERKGKSKKIKDIYSY
jgi:hypothetical protein